MTLPTELINHITHSHPPPAPLLSRQWLNRVYRTLWQTRFKGSLNKRSQSHVDFIDSVTTNQGSEAGAFRKSTGLVITTWNRPRYLQKCLEALSRSEMADTTVVIVDDASDDELTLELIRSFNPDAPLIRIAKRQRTSMHVGLDIGWCLLRNLGCQYLCNLDSDAIVRTDWLTSMRSLFESVPYPRDTTLLSGFNRANDHCVLEEHDRYLRKYRMGGINYFFTPAFYNKVRFLMFNSNWDSHIQYYCGTQHPENYHMICCRPSVIQHIGRIGLNARNGAYFDEAVDFVADWEGGPQDSP